jgi:predicted nucleotidyltransferase
METGLSNRDKATILAVFRNHPEILLVYLFGSRAKGDFKDGSDVDLAIMNEGVTDGSIRAIKEAFEESSLPCTVDVINYPNLKQKELKDHIDRVGIEFYKKE